MLSLVVVSRRAGLDQSAHRYIARRQPFLLLAKTRDRQFAGKGENYPIPFACLEMSDLDLPIVFPFETEQLAAVWPPEVELPRQPHWERHLGRVQGHLIRPYLQAHKWQI